MFARTARLTLRPAWPEDAPAVAAAIAHREIANRLCGVPWPHMDAAARDWLAIEPRRPDAAWLILSHEGDYPRIVGGIGLSRCERESGQQLGYWLTPDVWGRGYATEAGRAAVDAAHRTLGLDRLTATCGHDNPASARVLEKLGFRRTGDADQPCRAAGGHGLPDASYALDLSDRSSITPLPPRLRSVPMPALAVAA